MDDFICKTKGEIIVEMRPDFSSIKCYDEFIKYYWYRKELEQICKNLGISHSGTKQDLNKKIQEYFNGNVIQKKRSVSTRRATKEISRDCPLLDCGFSFNARFRAYFSEQIGVKHFKFTADMATAWRKVKQERDRTFTIQDMLDLYEGNSNYAQYDHSSCEWNQFLKDFCADDRNKNFRNKLKTASVLWTQVRDSSMPKVYSHELVEAYWELIREYSQESDICDHC